MAPHAKAASQGGLDVIVPLTRSAVALAAAHLRRLASVRQIWADLRRARRIVDPDYYLSNNPDVKAMGLPPALHYALYGEAERRRPAALPGESGTRLARDAAPATTPARSHENAARFYDEKRPAVSVIVLNHGKSGLTLACLEALWEHTSGHSYEIVVVDNGSPADDFAKLAKNRGRFRLVRLTHNRFFGEGNNLGAEAARADRLMFLNNDTLVTSGWLEPLMRVLDERPDAGAVGGTLLYPDGVIQEAGATVAPDGRAIQRRRGERDGVLRNVVEPVDYCSAAALLVRRDAFEAVLGFDLMWEPAFYEDVDLCLQLARAGWKTYYCSASGIVHLEHGTTGDNRHGFEGSNLISINRLKFLSRWGAALATRPIEVVPAQPRGVRAVIADKHRLGLYTPHALIPGGGERYLLTIAEAAAADFDVTLITDTPNSHLRVLQLGRELGLDLDGLRRTTTPELRGRPIFDLFIAIDAVILPPIGAQGKRNVYVCQFPFPLSAHKLARRWGHLEQYDRVVVYSQFARRHTCAAFEALSLSRHPVVDVVPPPVPNVGGSDAARGPKILSVGRFYAGGHPKRHDVLIEAFRELHRVRPDAELHLAGALHPEPQHRRYFLDLREQAQGLPVTFHVNASRPALDALYRQASVYWHAAGFGVEEAVSAHQMEHFGIAVVEAMSAGTIPIGFAGGGLPELISAGTTGFLFHGLRDLCDQTARILAEPQASWVREMRHASLAASCRYQPGHFATAMRRLFTAELVEPGSNN